MDQFKITLMDGRQLDCFLKSEQPQTIEQDTFELDTTGQYLRFNRMPKNVSEEDLVRAERQYGHHIFTENAWFFLQNAEKILSDSRMFLAPVKVQNGLAYTGTSGFGHPTLGIYLEWWINYSQAAIDANGNLVWYISGSPLSGCNCCSSVNPDGKQVKIAQSTRFLDIWSSFTKVNNRYNEAKQRCEAYSLEEVIFKLKGDDYRFRIMELKHECIYNVMKSNYSKLFDRLADLQKRFTRHSHVNKRLQLESKKEDIKTFLGEYKEKEARMKIPHEEYLKVRKELRQQLRDGTFKGDYKAILNEASREYRLLRHELSDMAQIFLRKTFSNNPNGISLNDVLRFAKQKNLC